MNPASPPPLREGAQEPHGPLERARELITQWRDEAIGFRVESKAADGIPVETLMESAACCDACADELEEALNPSAADSHSTGLREGAAPATEPQGTFACPICGVEGIHTHGDDDVFYWLDAQASRFGYRLVMRYWLQGQWALRRDRDGETLTGRVDHCLHRLGQADMYALASTPMGRFITDVLRHVRPIVEHSELLDLPAASPAGAVPPDASTRSEAQIAETIAILAHHGQTCRYGQEAFLCHPAAVAALLPDEFKAVGWLHDVLEDSAFTEAHLVAAGISAATIDAVKLLTRTGEFQKPENYDAYIDHIIASGNRAAIAGKLADLTHNLRPTCPARLRPRYESAQAKLVAAHGLARPQDTETPS